MKSDLMKGSMARKAGQEPNRLALELIRVVNGYAINRNAVIKALEDEGYSAYVAKAAVTFAVRMVAPEIIPNTLNSLDAAEWLKGNGYRIGAVNLSHEMAVGNIRATIDLRTTVEALREWMESDRRGAHGREMGKVWAFDLFGTLTRPIRKPVKCMCDQEWLPGVMDGCEYLRDRGHKLAVVSNQGGVAYGLLTFAEAEALVKETAAKIGAVAWRMCPHHPVGTVKPYNRVCRCRKPGPNMINSIRRSILSFNYQQRPVVYVGDTENDRQTAINAGAEFIKAAAFFGQFITKDGG